jgi:two-component system, cell cycle response regulator
LARLGPDKCVASGRDFKVLVADDSPVYRKLVETTLAPQHSSILFAKSGSEALDLFAKHQPELVITDCVMPDIDGVELCRRVRADFQGSYAYIIILTSTTGRSEAIVGLAAGADDYLTKPFQPDELIARVGVGRRIVEFHRQIEAKNRLLEELALTDTLTGLPNRRAIEMWATTELTAAVRHGFSFWVVMADLDCFKSVNDTFGHGAGDGVLKRFADILRANSRRSDICGRIGGEEFLIILTHTDEKGAMIAVERMREEFAEQIFKFGSRDVFVTASFGIAGLSSHAQDFKWLNSRADAALYAAKRSGRNRVALAAVEAPRV